MATFTIPGIDGSYTSTLAQYYTDHALSVVPNGATGTLTIEARYPGAGTPWLPVPYGTILLDDGPATLRFNGPAAQYRFTLSGSGGSGAIAVTTAHSTEGPSSGYNAAEIAVIPELAAGPAGYRRIRVDTGEAGFWYGRQFGFSYPFSIPNGGRLALKFEIAVDTILLGADVSIDQGTLLYRAYGGNVAETTPFTGSPLPLVPLNTLSFAPAYTAQLVIHNGGDINEANAVPYPTVRLRTANATAQQITVESDQNDLRGFGPGTAYILLTQLSGTSGITTGVVNLKLEERDFGY